jgi:hypothetical protein
MSNCRCSSEARYKEDPSSRRQFLSRCGMGLGALGLASLLSDEALSAAVQSGTAKATHFPAKAKHVIHIFARGLPRRSTRGIQNRNLPEWMTNHFPASVA